jgi:hypothetical protein
MPLTTALQKMWPTWIQAQLPAAWLPPLLPQQTMPLPKQQHKLLPQPHCKLQPLQQQLLQTTPWLPQQSLHPQQPPQQQQVPSLQQQQTASVQMPPQQLYTRTH